MATLTSGARRYPLVTFFVLAFALSWALVPLVSVSLAFPVLGLFGPALAALIVTAITEGRPGLRALLGRLAIWRVAPSWYVVALGLPVTLALATVALHLLLGGRAASRPGGDAILMLIVAILGVGEELGWRGYALPRLQTRYSGLVASLILAALWAAWHVINTLIPGLERYGYAFPAFLFFVTTQTILFTWIANHTRGSVLIAWLFHAAINVAGSVFFIGDSVRQWWLSGAVYGVTALLVVLMAGPNLTRKPDAEMKVEAEPVPTP